MAHSSSDGGTTSRATGSRLDRALTALAHRYRRRVLYYVDEHAADGRTTLEVSELPVAAADRPQPTVELCHVHLPSLADAGYIEWDAEARTVRRGPVFDEVVPLLSALADHCDDHFDRNA